MIESWGKLAGFVIRISTQIDGADDSLLDEDTRLSEHSRSIL